jgi:predicted exporter
MARAAVRYALAALAIAIAVLVAVKAVRIETDFSAFLPPSAGAEEKLLVSQLREGVVSRLMLVALEGADERTLAAASRAVAGCLEGLPEFTFVANGESARFLKQSQVLLAHRYVLSDRVTPERFTEAGLREALEESFAILRSPAGALISPTLPRDPTGEFRALLQRLDAGVAPASRHGVWFGADGKRAFLIAQTKAAGFDSDGQAVALEKLNWAVATYAPGVRAVTSGPGVFAAESKRLIRADTQRLGYGSAALILLLLAIFYRSPLAIALVLVPTAVGLLAGVLVVQALFGTVHAITLAFAATLVGESVDYPSYVLLNASPGETARAAARRVGRTLALAVLTTVASASALALSSFQGLAQLGTLTMVGVVVAGLASRWLVPWLLGDRMLTFPQINVPEASRLGASPWPGRVMLLAVAASAIGLTITHPSWWERDLAALSPVPAPLRALDAELRREIGAPEVSLFVAAGGASEAEALAAVEALHPKLDAWRQRGLLRSYDSPARYVPSAALQQARRAALPDRATLEGRLAVAVKAVGFRADAFKPFVDDIERARTATDVTRASYAGSAIGTRLDAQLLQADGRWLALVPVSGVENLEHLRAAVEAEAKGVAQLADLRSLSTRMLDRFRLEALQQAALGALAIAVLLAFGLGSVRRAARVLLPVAAAIVLTVGVLVALGHRLGVFHLVALLLVLGIGLNYALFFERPPEDAAERARTRRALALCSASTIITFGILAMSATPVLRAIGASVAIGAVCSMLCAAVWAREAQPFSSSASA